MVWWGALRGAIGLALALVVYSENLRYEFEIEDGGSGYSAKTTSVFVVDSKEALSYSQPNPNLNLYGMAANTFAKAEISKGRIVGISQSAETAEPYLVTKTQKMRLNSEKTWQVGIRRLSFLERVTVRLLKHPWWEFQRGLGINSFSLFPESYFLRCWLMQPQLKP